MWQLCLYLMIHIYIAMGNSVNIIFNQDYGETALFSHISDCIKDVSDLELNYKPTVVIDVQYAQDKQKGMIFTEEVVNKLQENNIPTVIVSHNGDTSLLDNIFIIEDPILQKIYYLDGLIVMYIEACGEVSLNIFSKINRNVKHLIIISEPINKCTNKLNEIRDLVGKYDFTFMFRDLIKNQSQLPNQPIFTFMPKIDSNTCHEVIEELIHINTCVNGSLLHKKIFPSKNPSNLNKCPFRVGMATLFPFSVIKDKELLQTFDHINESVGSDMQLMKIVAKHFNATLDLYYIYRIEENPFGEYGFLKYLLNGSLDVCAGGLYRIYGDVVEYSGIYARQAVVWIYVGERIDRSWQNLVKKVDGLYIFVIFYVTYSIIWYFICIFDKNAVSFKNTLLYGWGALVGATSLQEARTIKQRILNLGYLIMSIHLSAYVSVQLYSFLTIREPPQLFNTNEDVMASGRVPYLKTSTKYFIDDKRYNNFANTSGDCVSFLDCAEKTLEHNGLTVVLQANFYHFQSATAVKGEAKVLRATENLLTVYNEMLIRKDSPLVLKFRQLVQSLFEAGITERLYNEAIGILVMAKADSANSNMVANSYSCQAGCTITFMQITGVFYVWLFGCAFSCVVFLIEICIKRERNLTFVN